MKGREASSCCLLDLPEPWRIAHHAVGLVPGGIFLSYVPTVPQVVQTTEALRSTGAFGLIETVEVLLRRVDTHSHGRF